MLALAQCCSPSLKSAVRFALSDVMTRRDARTREAGRERPRLVVTMRAEGSKLQGKKGLPLPITQPNGYMWSIERKMRPSTPEEESCQPEQDTCAIPRIVKTYDSVCEACLGTGSVKTRPFSSSRFRKIKPVSCRCMLCGGVGIRTTRVEPDFSKGDSAPAEYRPGEKKEEKGSKRLTIK